MMVAALLPLLIGSSVGPEAGLTGIIVGLCYWAGDNLKFAKQNTRNYSQIGAAVSMSVLFHAPLFGIFEVEENSEEDLAALTKGSKLFIYGIALAAGTGIYAGLSALFGAGLSGFSLQQWSEASLSHSNQSRNLLQITASNRVATRQKEPLYQKTWLYASGNNYNFCI